MSAIATPEDLPEPASPRPLDAGLVYEALREDIVLGRLSPSERLVIAALAARYGTSTNPVREALQQLRGEGLVVFTHNRGARVRAIDEAFIRDIYEVAELIEAQLVGGFVPLAAEPDIARLEAIQDEYEAVNFTDPGRVAELDLAFHSTIYDRHHNRLAVELWRRQRDTLATINRGFPVSLSRRRAVLEQHRALIAAIAAEDSAAAVAVIVEHVRGAGEHFVEQMRSHRNSTPA
jgi:DNA-binding GntR family transcriptional regulator